MRTVVSRGATRSTSSIRRSTQGSPDDTRLRPDLLFEQRLFRFQRLHFAVRLKPNGGKRRDRGQHIQVRGKLWRLALFYAKQDSAAQQPTKIQRNADASQWPGSSNAPSSQTLEQACSNHGSVAALCSRNRARNSSAAGAHQQQTFPGGNQVAGSDEESGSAEASSVLPPFRRRAPGTGTRANRRPAEPAWCQRWRLNITVRLHALRSSGTSEWFFRSRSGRGLRASAQPSSFHSRKCPRMCAGR